MDSSGFSSTRFDFFPAGLRVLVVDDDPTWLKILEKMLKKCNYEVTTCNLAWEALSLLRERKDGFDIVISDVNMPDMDGFRLLEHVGLEMDLPVIMMSVDGETSRVMKGVQHGACDYLLKPISMKKLRNIWQHVFRKRMHEVRDIEGLESLDEILMSKNRTEQSDDSYSFCGDVNSGKKRKDYNNKQDERVYGDSSSAKKARVVWTVELHQKFVKAVNQIGFDKIGPKKILDLMGVPWLTRENVASHLQKYRLYLSKLPKENELESAFGEIKHFDISTKDSSANVCIQKCGLQNPITLQRKIVKSDTHTASAHNVSIQKSDSKICEGNVNNVLSMPKTESENALSGDVIDPPMSSSSRISFCRSPKPVDSEAESEPSIQAQYSWSPKVSSIQFKQEQKPHIAWPMHNIQDAPVQPRLSFDPIPSSKDAQKPTVANIKPSNGKRRSPGREKVTKVESTAALFSAQPQTPFPDPHALDKIPTCTKNQVIEQNPLNDPQFFQGNTTLGTESAFRLWDNKFSPFSSPGDLCPPNTDLWNIESFGFSNQDLMADIPPHLYDTLNFDYPSDPLEYHAIDHGLYIA